MACPSCYLVWPPFEQRMLKWSGTRLDPNTRTYAADWLLSFFFFFLSFFGGSGSGGWGYGWNACIVFGTCITRCYFWHFPDLRREMCMGIPGQRLMTVGAAKSDDTPALLLFSISLSLPGLVLGMHALQGCVKHRRLHEFSTWIFLSVWPGSNQNTQTSEEVKNECF